jgi:hypothetical protein
VHEFTKLTIIVQRVSIKPATVILSYRYAFHDFLIENTFNI